MWILASPRSWRSHGHSVADMSTWDTTLKPITKVHHGSPNCSSSMLKTRWIVWFMHVCARYIGLIHLQLGGLSLQNTLGIHVGSGIQGVLWLHPSFLRLRPRGRNCLWAHKSSTNAHSVKCHLATSRTHGNISLPCLITLGSLCLFNRAPQMCSSKYVICGWATVGLPKSDVYVALEKKGNTW